MNPLFQTLLAAGTALSLGAVAQAVPYLFEAEFEMLSGEKAPGVIRSVKDQNMVLELRLPGLGTVKSTTAFTQINRAEFRRLEEVTAALSNTTDKREELLAAQWTRWKPLTGLPESPAPELGMAYAQALISRRESKGAKEVLEQLARESWDKEVGKSAKSRLKLVDLLEGSAAEVVEKATKVLRESDDLALRSEANLLVGRAAMEELSAFLEENPRWEQDPLARPEYHRLSNLALDSYLQPSLYDGRNVPAASQGLLGAAQVYAYLGKQSESRNLAEDLQRFYPGTIEAGIAKTTYLQDSPAPSTP